ncbi:hypothetical protein Aperf_G00000031709 [Anoplocephala perfoliata]
MVKHLQSDDDSTDPDRLCRELALLSEALHDQVIPLIPDNQKAEDNTKERSKDFAFGAWVQGLWESIQQEFIKSSIFPFLRIVERENAKVMYSVNAEHRNINGHNNSALEIVPVLSSSYHLIGEASRVQKCDFVLENNRSPEALFKACLVAFQKGGKSTFTDVDLLERCIQLPITDNNRMELIRTINRIFLFNEEEPTYSSLKPKDRKPSENLRSIKEILLERRNRKEELMSRSIARIEEMFRRNTPATVLSIIRRLQLYLDIEKVAESNDAFELLEHRQLTKPHENERRKTSYICVFCCLKCHSITALQAHLISQKHHFLNLPEIWVDAIKRVRQYEVEQLVSMERNPKFSGKSAATYSHVADEDFERKSANDYYERVLRVGMPEEGEMNANNEGSNSVQLTSETKTGIDAVSEGTDDFEEEEKVGEFDQEERIKESLKEAESPSEVVKLKPVIAHYTTCLFCGKSLEDFIDEELNLYDENGSPLTCLLCQCRIFSSPEALMIHVVGQHCASANPRTCPLCGACLTPRDEKCFKIESSLQLLALDRHLKQTHLPQLEVTGRLVQSFDESLVQENMAKNLANNDTIIRSYRCCFLTGETAGAGPPFPFPHWRQRNRHRFEYNEEENQFTTLLPRFGRNLPSRPKRLMANRKCLLNPSKLFEVLRYHWMQKTDRLQSSLFAFLFGLSPQSTAENWCSFKATSLSSLIVHVGGQHGGNYLMQPGLRESYIELFQHRLETRVPPLEKWSLGLLSKGGRQFEQGSDKLRELRTRVQMKPMPVLRNFEDPLPLGTKGNNLLLKIERDFDCERIIQKKDLIAKMKNVYEKLDPLEACFRVRKNYPDEVSNNDTDALTPAPLPPPLLSSISDIRNSKTAVLKQTEIGPSVSYSKRDIQAEFATDASQKSLPSFRGPRIGNETGSRKWSSSYWRTARISFQRSLAEEIFCHICLDGPMGDLSMLNEHLHIGIFQNRLERMKEGGSSQITVDPMRTCFQCYKVVVSFIALQVHIVCAHASLYPFVCGLCHQPFTLQGLVDDQCREATIALIREAAEKVDPMTHKFLISNGFLADIEIHQKLPEMSLDDKMHNIYQKLHVGVTFAVEAEEIRQLRSAIYAGFAVMNMPVVYLQEAIETHEHMHIRHIRDDHFGISAYTGQAHHESRERKTSAILEEFIHAYNDTVHDRIQNEFEVLNKLALASIERPIQASEAGLKPVLPSCAALKKDSSVTADETEKAIAVLNLNLGRLFSVTSRLRLLRILSWNMETSQRRPLWHQFGKLLHQLSDMPAVWCQKNDL